MSDKKIRVSFELDTRSLEQMKTGLLSLGNLVKDIEKSIAGVVGGPGGQKSLLPGNRSSPISGTTKVQGAAGGVGQGIIQQIATQEKLFKNLKNVSQETLKGISTVLDRESKASAAALEKATKAAAEYSEQLRKLGERRKTLTSSADLAFNDRMTGETGGRLAGAMSKRTESAEALREIQQRQREVSMASNPVAGRFSGFFSNPFAGMGGMGGQIANGMGLGGMGKFAAPAGLALALGAVVKAAPQELIKQQTDWGQAQAQAGVWAQHGQAAKMGDFSQMVALQGMSRNADWRTDFKKVADSKGIRLTADAMSALSNPATSVWEFQRNFVGKDANMKAALSDTADLWKQSAGGVQEMARYGFIQQNAGMMVGAMRQTGLGEKGIGQLFQHAGVEEGEALGLQAAMMQRIGKKAASSLVVAAASGLRAGMDPSAVAAIGSMAGMGGGGKNLIRMLTSQHMTDQVSVGMIGQYASESMMRSGAFTDGSGLAGAMIAGVGNDARSILRTQQNIAGIEGAGSILSGGHDSYQMGMNTVIASTVIGKGGGFDSISALASSVTPDVMADVQQQLGRGVSPKDLKVPANLQAHGISGEQLAAFVGASMDGRSRQAQFTKGSPVAKMYEEYKKTGDLGAMFKNSNMNRDQFTTVAGEMFGGLYGGDFQSNKNKAIGFASTLIGGELLDPSGGALDSAGDSGYKAAQDAMRAGRNAQRAEVQGSTAEDVKAFLKAQKEIVATFNEIAEMHTDIKQTSEMLQGLTKDIDTMRQSLTDDARRALITQTVSAPTQVETETEQ